MARKHKPDKYTLSLSVLTTTKGVLEAQSAATGLTMSELADVAILEKYSPKSGLWDRLKHSQQVAYQKHHATLEAIKDNYDTAIVKAESDYNLAKMMADEQYGAVVSQCDLEWGESTQRLALEVTDGDQLVRRLFDRGIWCIANWDATTQRGDRCVSPRYFGGWMRVPVACIMDSPAFPDKNYAADIVADLHMWTLGSDYLRVLLGSYESDVEKLYAAFSSQDPAELSKLLGVVSMADTVLGGSLAKVFYGGIPQATREQLA